MWRSKAKRVARFEVTIRWHRGWRERAYVYRQGISSRTSRWGHHITAEDLRLKAFSFCSSGLPKAAQRCVLCLIAVLTQRLNPAIVFESEANTGRQSEREFKPARWQSNNSYYWITEQAICNLSLAKAANTIRYETDRCDAEKCLNAPNGKLIEVAICKRLTPSYCSFKNTC